MCKFFSAVSNGKGKVLFFKIEDVAKLMAEGNPQDYDPNSHTSLMDYKGIKGAKEDEWNKWEYNVDKKILEEDSIVTLNDGDEVKKQIEQYLEGKDLVFIRNLYGRNSGNRNSGDLNSGDRNSGDLNSGNRNSGDLNSGNRNSGDLNSGDLNSGNRNSGDLNSGNRNSGDLNSGDRNSGNRNSGDRNSGDRNSGDRNSGNRNSGDLNSGDLNSGDRNSGYLNSNEPKVRMFNKDTGLSFDEIDIPSWMFDLRVTDWITFDNMTDQEKIDYPKAYVCEGYLKKIDYKEAWKVLWDSISDDQKSEVKELPNFDSKVFEEITGINIK